MSAIQRLLTPILLALVLISAVRFLIGLTRPAFPLDGPAQMADGYDRTTTAMRDGRETPGRRWGPLFVMAFGGLRALHLPEATLNVTLRAILLLLYAVMVYLLVRMCGPPGLGSVPLTTRLCRVALIVLSLLSTSAVYSISIGGLEVALGCGVIGHLYFFERKQYVAAAIFMWLGVYLKLWPVLFVWPFALFSLLSPAHRSYLRALALSWLMVAAVSLPIGWRWGVCYPFTMVYDIVTAGSRMVPPVSNLEVFGLALFFSRLKAGFAVDAPELRDGHLINTIVSVATFLLVLSTSAAAVLLARAEKHWRGAGDRRLALIVFQSVLGFLAVSFAVDVSMAHLVFYVMVGLYSVVLVVANRPFALRWSPVSVCAAGLFLGGLVLAANLLPLSIVERMLPLAWFDKLAGNAPGELIPFEQFVWYQIPLVGIYLIAIALGLTLAATRRLISPALSDTMAG